MNTTQSYVYTVYAQLYVFTSMSFFSYSYYKFVQYTCVFQHYSFASPLSFRFSLQSRMGEGEHYSISFYFFSLCGAPAPSMKCGGVNALTTGQAHCERDFTGRGPRGHYPTSKATYSAAPESRALQSVAAPILHFTNKKLFFYQKS